MLTDSAEQFDPERSEDVEQQEEQQSKVADFRQSLHNRV